MPSLAEIRAERARRATEADRRRLRENIEAIRDRCTSLAQFVREAWHILEPNTKLVWNWHLDALCLHLEAITDGAINRLLANVPPGSSKSLIVSVLWPAWEWGPKGRRSLRYLATSFNDGPVTRDTRKTRDLIRSDWYQALWPEVVLTRFGETSFANSDTGTREGVSFGSLTSQRGDRLIIDDPHSTETAESDAERTRTTRKFREGATNRLNDQEKSAIVVVMQRLHEQDISGVIMSLGMDFVRLCIPMEFEPERRCKTSIGWEDPRTHDGDLMDPVRFPRTVIDALKRDMGSYAWAGQYQQRPAPREGGMFKRGWFDIVDVLPAAPDWRRCRGWDFAATEGAGDYTAGVKVAYSASLGRFVVLDVVHDRLGPAGVDRLLKNTADQDGVGVTQRIPQDAAAAGKADSLTKVKLLVGHDVRVERPTGAKEVRARPAAAQAEAGNVSLIRAPWNEVFMDELCTFPAGTHDDQLDAFADAVSELALAPAPARRVKVSR